MSTTPSRERNLGLGYGIAAYVTWGVVPIFWRHLTHVPARELLAHRIVWGLIAFGGLLIARRGVPAFRAALSDRRTLATMAGSAALLSVNWLTFIYAVNTGRVLHASLGYFLNPLVSVALGVIFLRERLRPIEAVAVALAAVGVAQMALRADQFPWIALVVSSTFGLYGLIRKTARVDALPGSTLEVLLLAPVAATYLIALAVRGDGQLGHTDAATHGLLLATGIITAVPLVWFANATRRLTLATIGFLQYLAPTGQFLLAVLAFGEAFQTAQLRAFACIWAALALFSYARWRMVRGWTRVA